MKKIFITLILGLFLISFISAEVNPCGSSNNFLTDIGQQNKPITLKAICDNCTYVNITSMTYPNGTIELFNLNTTKSNLDYVRAFTGTSETGCYTFSIKGDKNGINNSAYIDFMITPTGNEFNSSQGLIFFLIDFLLLFLFLGCVYGAIVTPFKNERSGSGEEIARVNWKKYLKIFLIGLAYMFLIALVFVTWTLIYAYAQWNTLGKFFYYLYRLLMVGAMLMAPVGFVLLVMNYFNDKKIDSSLKKGVPVYR